MSKSFTSKQLEVIVKLLEHALYVLEDQNELDDVLDLNELLVLREAFPEYDYLDDRLEMACDDVLGAKDNEEMTLKELQDKINIPEINDRIEFFYKQMTGS